MERVLLGLLPSALEGVVLALRLQTWQVGGSDAESRHLVLDWYPETVLGYFRAHWSWAAALAATMMGLTASAGLLNRDRRDAVALWLMGATTDERWAQSFTTLFDAVFGRRHLSLRCLFRSAVASVVAVIVIWLLMGSAETVGVRLEAGLNLGSALLFGLAINVAADYVSLLETRWLLGRMPRGALAQAGVLVLDLFVSAAIIWGAIFLFLRSPLYRGEVDTFPEVLGVFSIFSVFFYSTFLTSVWTWVYVASSWIMRLFARLQLDDWLDVEERPVLILSNVVGMVTFLGALAVAGPLTRDDKGLTAVDRTLCTLFEGRVCLDVGRLTDVQEEQFRYVLRACGGEIDDACREPGAPLDPRPHARELHKACLAGSIEACAAYGVGRLNGDLGHQDAVEAVPYLRIGCEGGHGAACVSLGSLQLAVAVGEVDDAEALGLEPDAAEAISLIRRGCEGDFPSGCLFLALAYERGFGVEADPDLALLYSRMACRAGHHQACRLACQRGDEAACSRIEHLTTD